MPFTINPFYGKLDAINDLSGYVPYTGATTNVDIGAFSLTASGIILGENDEITLAANSSIYATLTELTIFTGGTLGISALGIINITSSNSEINFKPSGDSDDYLRFTTVGNKPTISAIGDCDLVLNTDNTTSYGVYMGDATYGARFILDRTVYPNTYPAIECLSSAFDGVLIIRSGGSLKYAGILCGDDIDNYVKLAYADDIFGSYYGKLVCTKLLYINSDTGAIELTAASSINFKPSGDTSDYLTLSTTSDIPYINIVGGGKIRVASDSATFSTLEFFNAGTSNSLIWGIKKSDDTGYAYCTGVFNFITENSYDNYLQFKTTGGAGNSPEIAAVGSSNLKITAATGTISLDNDNLTTSGNITISADNSHLYLGTGSPTDLDIYYSASGGVFKNLDVTTIDATGKLQFYGEYTPTSGTGGNVTGNYFYGKVDVSAINSGAEQVYCNQFNALYKMGVQPSGSHTIYGTAFTNTITGTYVSGFGGAWSGTVGGVFYDIDFTGKFATVAGMNFYPYYIDIDITTTAVPSTQLLAIKSDVTLNAAVTFNQLFGWYHTLEMASTAACSGHMSGFMTELVCTSSNTIANHASFYRAYLNVAYDEDFNTALTGAEDKVIGFYVNQSAATWAMAARYTYGFYSELANNTYNYAFVSDGADGWMAADNTAWVFGAGKDASITFDGDSLNITANLITAADALEFTAGHYHFIVPADTDNVINFFGTTHSGVLTWMEDEDYFKFDDDILITSGEYLYFHTTSHSITSDGTDLLLASSGKVRTAGALKAADYYAGDGSQGLTMTVTLASGEILGFVDGLLTGYTPGP